MVLYMLKCPRCGAENSDMEMYCAKCQNRLPSITALRSTLRSGLEALEKRDFRKAQDRFMDVVRQNPADLDAWFLLAAVKMRTGRGSEAWDDLTDLKLARSTGQCSKCRGIKKCKECGGTGICIMCRGTKRCSYCGGVGDCPTCKNRNPKDCTHCKGTGQCIRCKGSKECTYCNGFGQCISCRGTGICTFCGGTGTGHELDLSKVSKEFHELKAWF